jgi:hypothetical protein
MCILDFIGITVSIHYDYINLENTLAISFITHLISGSAWLNTDEWNDIDKFKKHIKS